MKLDDIVDAPVERIALLFPGALYKRAEKESYSDNIQIVYGKVLDIMNNGETKVISAVEYTSTYNSYEPKIKAFKGDKDLEIFPATKEEAENYLNAAIAAVERQVETKQRELAHALTTQSLLSELLQDIEANVVPSAPIASGPTR